MSLWIIVVSVAVTIIIPSRSSHDGFSMFSFWCVDCPLLLWSVWSHTKITDLQLFGQVYAHRATPAAPIVAPLALPRKTCKGCIAPPLSSSGSPVLTYKHSNPHCLLREKTSGIRHFYVIREARKMIMHVYNRCIILSSKMAHWPV